MTLDYQLKDKIDPELTSKVVSLVKLCDSGRYGPKAEKSMNSLQFDASELLKEVDKTL
jgi:hypothetical protein